MEAKYSKLEGTLIDKEKKNDRKSQLEACLITFAMFAFGITLHLIMK